MIDKKQIVPQAALDEFCRKWKVSELSVFGSVLREDFGPESDIDFLISFEPGAGWDLYDLVAMRDELSLLTGREVDLVVKESLRNPYRRAEILSTREILHAA